MCFRHQQWIYRLSTTHTIEGMGMRLMLLLIDYCSYFIHSLVTYST